MHLYFSTGNGQPREPALYRMYRDTFVQYRATAHVSLVVGEVVVVVVAAADTDVRLAKHLSSQVPQVARDLHRYDTIRYDAMRDATLTCAQKLTLALTAEPIGPGGPAHLLALVGRPYLWPAHFFG